MTDHPIRRFRLSAGLSQAELARALKVGRSAICHWEAGRRVPDRCSTALLIGLSGGALTLNDLAPRRCKEGDE
jgi:DNA-binding transcriptional regulator YiaG